MSKYSQAEIDLALERGLKNPGLEGGFAWMSLIPILGPLVNPIVEGIGKRVGKWIGGRQGGSFGPTMGGSFWPTRGAGMKNNDFQVMERGADTPQPTQGMGNFYNQSRNIDRFGSGVAGMDSKLAIIKGELQPYVKNPEAFKAKLTDLIKMGQEVQAQGAPVGGRIKKKPKRASKK